jgi:hypothetical protein
MQQPANCSTHSCNGIPPCSGSVYSPNNPAVRNAGPNTVLPCANAAFNGDLNLYGRTTCHADATHCSGNVPLLATGNGTVNANSGHGTICSFSLFDPTTRLFAAPGQCTQF